MSPAPGSLPVALLVPVLGALAAVCAGVSALVAGHQLVALLVVGLLLAQTVVFVASCRSGRSERCGPPRTTESTDRAWTDLRPDVVGEHLWVEIEEVARAAGRPADEIVRESVRRHREDLEAGGYITDAHGRPV